MSAVEDGRDPSPAHAPRMQALARLPEMEAKKKVAQEELARKKAAGKKVSRKEEQNAKARVSSTDPQATVMKMANGGYNPAYNVEYSTACQGMSWAIHSRSIWPTEPR